MARLDDGTIGFVEGALPGETVAVQSIERKKGYVRAREYRLIDASNERVEPSCAAARTCGGCDFLHVEYTAQLRHKGALLAEALRRTGGFQALEKVEVEPSPRVVGYRSRVRVHIDEDGEVGFFGAKSRRLVVVSTCVAAAPELDRALTEFRAVLADHRELARWFDQAELRVAPSEPARAVILFPRRSAPNARERARKLVSALERRFAVVVAGEASGFVQRWPLEQGLWLSVSPQAFVQVNWELNLRMIQRVVELARGVAAKRFLDVYSGAGNFTLPLAALGLSGVSIEGHPEAAANAAASLEDVSPGRVRVVSAAAAPALNQLAAAGEHFDLVILDPPRAGAAELMPLLARLRPSYVAYVACDPVTLARDLRQLGAERYRLESVQGFDMFPGTHHVEALAWLRSTT
jgi:23S rRNA (uracil1939-C5)-methyltransferase